MTVFRHVSRINVSLWGQRVGALVAAPQRGAFAFRLKQGGAWELAPAYDLTGGDFPSADPWRAHSGVHQLSVNGRRRDITGDDLLAVADRFGIGTAHRVLAEVHAALSGRVEGQA